MTDLTLKRIAERYSDTESLKEIYSDSEMTEYIDQMQDVGIDIMRKMSETELAVAISFMQAMFTQALMNNGDIMKAMMLMSDDESFSTAMGQAFKFAIGMAITEEWR